MSRRSMTMLSLTAAAALALAGCSSSDDAKPEPAKEDKNTTSETSDSGTLTVYATTGYLADVVANVAPDAEVTTMVGPGGDPHTFQPSTKDIETIQAADVVFWNGLHLEAQMLDQLESLGDKQLAVGEMIPKDMLLDWPETDDEGNALHDPHIWNNPEIWSMVTADVAKKLGEVDPDNAETYKKNADEYIKKIKDADLEAQELLSSIPEGSRVLVTGHDAFNYFGDHYNLEVHATDFVSSESQKSPEEISELADLIASKKVPVIFLDNLANPQAITSLKEAISSRGWDVQISDEELFADSLGAEDDVDSYLEVFLHNAKAIAEALGTK